MLHSNQRQKEYSQDSNEFFDKNHQIPLQYNQKLSSQNECYKFPMDNINLSTIKAEQTYEKVIIQQHNIFNSKSREKTELNDNQFIINIEESGSNINKSLLNEPISVENGNNSNDKSFRINNKKHKIFILTKIKKPKSWAKEEDEILIKLALLYKQKSWTKISKEFSDKSPAQCRARFKRIRPGIVKGPWSKQEDNMINSLVEKYGKNWALISRFMKTRNGKQIRDRFLNYLDPNINKNKFAEKEDNMIIQLYKENGPKWSLISQYFYGRTGDMIKNRFHSFLRRKVHMNEIINKPKRIIKRCLKLNNKKLKKKFSNKDKILKEYKLTNENKKITQNKISDQIINNSLFVVQDNNNYSKDQIFIKDDKNLIFNNQILLKDKIDLKFNGNHRSSIDDRNIINEKPLKINLQDFSKKIENSNLEYNLVVNNINRTDNLNIKINDNHCNNEITNEKKIIKSINNKKLNFHQKQKGQLGYILNSDNQKNQTKNNFLNRKRSVASYNFYGEIGLEIEKSEDLKYNNKAISEGKFIKNQSKIKSNHKFKNINDDSILNQNILKENIVCAENHLLSNKNKTKINPPHLLLSDNKANKGFIDNLKIENRRDDEIPLNTKTINNHENRTNSKIDISENFIFSKLEIELSDSIKSKEEKSVYNQNNDRKTETSNSIISPSLLSKNKELVEIHPVKYDFSINNRKSNESGFSKGTKKDEDSLDDFSNLSLNDINLKNITSIFLDHIKSYSFLELIKIFGNHYPDSQLDLHKHFFYSINFINPRIFNFNFVNEIDSLEFMTQNRSSSDYVLDIIIKINFFRTYKALYFYQRNFNDNIKQIYLVMMQNIAELLSANSCTI